MASVVAHNIKAYAALKAKLEKQQKWAKKTATKHVQDQVLKIFEYVLKQTPQQTGTLVANWQLVVGRGASAGGTQLRNQAWPSGRSAYPQFKSKRGKFSADVSNYQAPFAAGDKESMKNPMAIARVIALSEIKWNSVIKIVNTAEYALDLADGTATMGYNPERELEYRDANIARTEPGVLTGPFWNIEAAVYMRFKHLRAT